MWPHLKLKIPMVEPSVSPRGKGPDGTRISERGHIRWDMPRDTWGSYKVKTAARAEEGGEAVLQYTFTVRR